jgi:hypothetical protein
VSSNGSSNQPSVVQSDPSLDRIVDAWPTLPDPIRRAVLALIDSAANSGN